MNTVPIVFTPLITQEAIPIPHTFFAPVRAMLFCPMFHGLLEMCIDMICSSSSSSSSSSGVSQPLNSPVDFLGSSARVVLERVIYLLTVRIHVREFEGSDYSNAGTGAGGSGSSGSISGSSRNNDTWASALNKDEHLSLVSAVAKLWLHEQGQESHSSDDNLYASALNWVVLTLAQREQRWVRGIVMLFRDMANLLFCCYHAPHRVVHY